MSKCKVTTYKAVVNNPDLPIFETMSQFTLNAIALSGNSGMSDSQKYALNHFFYQMGAVQGSSIWQKVKFLFIPMICGDVASKAMNDYKAGSEIAAEGSASFVNHGLHYEGGSPSQIIGTDVFTGSSTNLSVFTATMKSTFEEPETFSVFLDKGSSAERRTLSCVHKSPNSNRYILNVPGLTFYSTIVENFVFNVGCVTNAIDSAFGVIHSSLTGVSIVGNASSQEVSTRASEITYSDNYLRLNMGANDNLGLLMITEAMTVTEAKAITEAVATLRNAFSESNS